MIDNLLGSLDYTAKLPMDVKENLELPKFPNLSPVNINSLLTQQKAEKTPISFDQILQGVESKFGRRESLTNPYFINRYEYDRFINSDKDNNSFFNWKKNPIFKNPMYFNNEELNAENQSAFRKFINGSSKALPGALGAFVSGLDPRPGVKENEFNQWINDWTKELEYTHPNYYTQDEKDHPLAFRNITSGNFWGDKLLKNAGFTVGAIASAIAWDAVITTATAGAGAVPATELALGKLITSLERQFSSVQKVIRGVEGTSMLGKTITSSRAAYAGIKDWSAGQKALNMAKLGYINYVGSNAEASLEGYQGLIDLNEKLIQEFTTKNGKEPEAEDYASIKKIATQMANTRYAINLPLLMVTNAIEFGTLFSPSKIIRTGGVGFGERIGANEAGQLFQRGWKDFSKLEKAGSILGSAPVRDFLAEGFQEGAQYSIEKATEDLGFKKFKNPNFRIGLSEYMESEALGIQKTFSENEGLESMFIGGLTGLITAGGTTAWDKFVSKKSEKEQQIIGANIDAYNTLASEDLLNADSFKDYLKAVAERDQINFDSTTTHLILEAQMEQAIKDKNAFAFKALQHDKLFNLISLATKLGKVDAFKLKIDQLKDLSVDEFAQQMGLGSLTENQRIALQDNIDDYIEVVKDRVDSMSEIIKTVDNGLLNKFDPQKEPAKFNAFNSLKETFAYQLSHIEDIQGRMTEEMDNILSSKVNPLSQSLINTLTGQEDTDESLIIDDFTKNFISEKGFDLNILNTKYAKGYTQQFNQLASEIASLNMQVETAKAAKLPYSGYASKLADKKKELTNLTSFLEDFNSKIKKFGETSALRKDFMHEEVIDSFKDLTAHVVQYEMNRDLKKSIGLTQADDLVNAIADLHLLNSSLSVFVDKNNKFRTPEGQDQYMNEYLKWKSFAENKVQEAVRKSKYETLRRTPEESINQLSSEISANLTEIETINAQLERIDAELLENPTEELEKQKEELLEEKKALVEENQELQETKEIIEGKVDTEEEFVTEDEEDEATALPEEVISTETTPIETIEPGMEIGLKRGLKAKWSSSSKKFIFFNSKGQRIVAPSQLKRQAVKLSNMPNVLKVWWNELLTNEERKNVVEIIPLLEEKLTEFFSTPRDTVQTSDAIIMDGLRGVKFKPAGVVNNATDLNHKTWISDSGLSLDRVVNEGLMDALYENGFTDMDEKEIADDIIRLMSAHPKGITKEDVKKELFQSSDNLNYEIREIEKEFLLRYGLDAVTTLEKLKEQIKEFNYEQNDESTGQPSPTETTTIVTGDIPTKTKTVTPVPTAEIEVLPYFGTSRLMHSFYYKLANRTFGNVMIASFHNFLGKLRTFDGIGHKQNLESFLNQNNLQFTVLLAPDELYTPNGDYFDEAYKDKKAPIVALTDKEGNLVKVDKNNNLSDDGNYIVSLLPPVNKDATDLQDFSSTVEKVKNGEKVVVEVDASHAGHFNFLGQPKEFVLTPEILENPNITLEIPNTKEAREVNGYTLMPGKLYLKIANNRNKSLMFLDVKLNKLNQISINGKSLPKTIYDSVLHIINNVDESLSYKQELDNFLNSILYVTAYKGSPKREPVIVQVNDDFYQFKIDTTSNEPSFTIEKNKEVIFELSNTKKDDVAALQNILKLFDLNDTEQGEIKIPILESGKLRFEIQDYVDFLVQNANPTVRYELDFSMENPFDFTGGEIYFKTPSKVEEVFTNTETSKVETTPTTSNQSEIETQKADIERRKQENDTLGKSILQKLGYKNENRLPNGNVKGGQAGWKIRFNIKNPKTGESYYDGKGTTTLLNDDYNKRAETLINFLLNYFGSNEKADSKNLQKHYVLEDKDGTRREPFKHLSGGEIGESDFTIYIGSADDVMKFISDIRTKHPEILELLHAGNKSEDVSIDDIFKGRIEGSKIGFSGYHAPTNLNKVIGSNDFTFNFNQNRVNINYNGSSLSGITIIVESSNKGYKGVFDENLKKDFPELYKNIRNIVGFQLYGDYLQGSNDEFLKLTGVDKINAKYDAELKAVEQQSTTSNQSEIDAKKDEIEKRKEELEKKYEETKERHLRELEKAGVDLGKWGIDFNDIIHNIEEENNSDNHSKEVEVLAKKQYEEWWALNREKQEIESDANRLSFSDYNFSNKQSILDRLKKAISKVYQSNRQALDEGFAEWYNVEREVATVGGNQYAAHGMGKTSIANAFTDLINLFEKGINPFRGQGALDVATLAGGISDGTTTGGAYMDGAFTLVANRNHNGRIENINQIGGIIVNEGIATPEVLSALKELFPNLVIESTLNSKSLVEQLNAKYDAELTALEAQETTIDEKTLEGFSSEEDLAKAFGTKPLEQSNDNSQLTKEIVESENLVKKKFLKSNKKINLESSKRLPIVQSLNVTNTDIEKVKAIFKGNVTVENLFQIANSDAWATFTQSAITLFKGATRADLFHEAWHHFSQLYLTKDEKVKLYEETRNKVKDLKDKSDLEVEEYIAREFAKFTETGKIEGKFPERKSIFQKIMDFLKSIFSNETDLSLDSLFNNLYKGQINHLAYNTENIMFGKLNSGINDNFNYNDSELIMSGLDALYVQALKSQDISTSQISKLKNLNDVYDVVSDYLIDQYEQSKNPTISSNLERILDNWNDVKKAHYKESVIFNKDRDSYEFDDDGDLVSKEENEDDKKGRNKADFQEASEKSIFDIMDKEVKSLIFTLVDKDKNGNEIVDPIFGLPKLVDFQRYVSIISEKLANESDFAGVEKVLNKLSKDYPSMKDLLNSLTINESNEVKHLRVQFIQNMALVKRELYVVLYNEESKTYNIKAAQSNKQNQVENDIKTYFVISPETKFIKKVNGENQITEPIVYENKDEGLDYDLPFIKSLGINLDVLDYLTEQQQIKFVKDFNIVFVVEHLNNYLKENGAIKDIFKALKTKINGKTQESAFKTLVNYNLTYLPENISSSFLNASGKIENENVMWATFDKDFSALQKAKTIQELIQNPNRRFYSPNNLDISSSKIMDLLFDQSGKRTKYKIDIQNYNGLATEKEGVDGKKTKEVFYTEKAIMDISQFMNRNILTTMQLSNKATYFGLELPKKLIDGKYEFEQTMLSYLFDELNIIYQFDQKNPELIKLKKLSDSIGTKGKYNLAIFKDILTSNTQEIIDEYLETGNLSNETQDFVLSQINQFFEIDLKKTVDVLQDDLYKIVPSKSSSYFEAKNFKPEEVIRDYNQNQFVMNVELSKLVFGNPYMHKDPYKRIQGATSSKRRLLADKRTLEDFKSVTKETQRSSIMPILLKRLKIESYGLKNQRTSDDELRFISFKDREKMSDSYDNLLSVVTKELKKTKEGTPEHYSLLQKKIAIEKAYSNVNGSDAMGAITMDAWRKFNWLAGRWSTELEKIYQKTIKWDYHNRLLKASKTEEEKTKQLALRNENTITDAEGLAISVMKYQYYGNIKNDSIMEKAFHKYQLMPLIPQLIEGKLWEQHLDRMILEDVDYALFDSADKLEKSKTLDAFYNNADLDNVNVLEDYESYYKEGNTSYNVRTGYLENIGEQVFMENGTDSSLLFGSQVRKLLFNTEDFSDLYDEFRNTIEQLTQIEKDNLYQKSGLNENGQVVDKPKFIQFLLDELDKKVVNSNVKEYLRLTKAGEFAGSLDTNLQRQPIESIVNSVIQNKIVKQKMHGEMMVQVSNVGFETFGKKDSLKFYELEDGKVRKMEVKVPLSGKFKNLLNLTHSDGRKIETRERLNEMISKGLIDTRAITMIGYRIPTQEHNSIEVMQVQEFLDPISNLIVVPYEITAKAGSDFDIDKLNIFKPHIDENGYYIERKFDSKVEALNNYLKVKSQNDPLIKEIRIEKFNWKHDLVKETDRIRQDIFTKINNLKNDLSFYKGQLSDNILFNAIVYEKNTLMSQMHQLFDDYMSLNSNQKDIGGEYSYKRGNASYKFKDKLKFTINKEVKEFLDKSNNTFIRSLFTEYVDISEETPIYDVKNKIVNDYNDRLNALLKVAIDLDARFIDNTDLKNKIQGLQGSKRYDSTGTFIGSEGEIQKLYSQFNSIFTNPKTAKITIKGEMPEELKNIYEKNMGFQFELSEELNKLYFDKNQAFIDMVNFKNSYQNKIIEIFDKVLLSPNNFLNLVTPNSTFMFDEALNDVFKNRYKLDEYYEKSGKLMPKDIKYTASLLPSNNWDTFRILGEAGLGLGIAAVGNTFSQLIQKAKVNFTEEYLSNYNLRLPIGDISTRVLKDGQPKATAYSQLINLLVDVANDPRVGYANMGDSVIPIVNLMINFGTPIQDIVYFINQPIIVDYISYTSKNRKSVVDGEYAEDGFRDYFNKVLLNSTKAYLNLGERPYKFNVKASELPALLDDVEFNISKDNMKYSTKDFKDGTKMTKEESDKLSKEQLLLLSQFAQFEEMAKDFLELQITMNFDTTLVQDGFEAYQKENLFAEIKERNVFTNLDTLRDSTVIAPLNVLKEVVNINAQLLPLANDKVIYNFLSFKLATDFAKKGNKTKKKFLRVFKNDFIMYIFQNFIDRSPKAMLEFNTTFAPVLKTEENKVFKKQNLFTVTPRQAVDKKAIIKASIATQYIGFGEGIADSSTESYRQQINEEYNKAVKEANLRPSTTNIPQNLQSSVEQYGTLQYANEEAQKLLGKNVTSIELIENGFRTRTTRTDKELEKYNIKVGGYIKMFGKDQFGNTKNVIVKITKITKGYDDATWHKEGWTQEGLQKLKDHTNSANSVEFKVINPIANTGNYSSNDVVFVSIGGKRGNETIRKEQQDKTIREALKAIEAGATLVTDNKAYVDSNSYNTGEKRLAKNLEAKGYIYSEQFIDGQVLGIWSKYSLNQEDKDFTNRPNAFGSYLLKNLYKDFAIIKNDPKYKDLFKQYLLLERLFVSSAEEFKNIGLSYFNKDSQLQDTYINQFKELLNHPDLEIRNFMLRFAFMSFYQSGLNKSFISSTDILPIKVLSNMLESVREQYLKEVNTPVKVLDILDSFYEKLLSNNEGFRSKENRSPEYNTLEVASYRGKYFRDNIDEILQSQKEEKETEESGCESPF